MLEEPPSPCRLSQPLRSMPPSSSPGEASAASVAVVCGCMPRSAAIASCHAVTTELPIRRWRERGWREVEVHGRGRSRRCRRCCHRRVWSCRLRAVEKAVQPHRVRGRESPGAEREWRKLPLPSPENSAVDPPKLLATAGVVAGAGSKAQLLRFVNSLLRLLRKQVELSCWLRLISS
ncbi:uncharacterized protein LOC130954408 [Arachis stenosperma]|uniref:uncharacterized protein LOC130954408 n=1 Tax=Arachis stenosperma TaxID=217475 RepID=UPI0025ACAC7B|nr:uncharacterized protein LOC130954408 [Arachis stenosperma]